MGYVLDSNRKSISRTPPPDVTRQLRREVGFGCPFATCRLPFLMWHHFDPPWKKEQHHRPEGMIALCVQHHAMADRGLYDNAYLRALKQSPHSVRDVIAKFAWASPKQLVRLGGFYVTPTGAFVLAKANYFSALSFDEDENGLLDVSFVLRDQQLRVLVEMTNNVFQVTPTRIYDLQVNPGGSKIKIKVLKTPSVLDLWTKSLSFSRLEEQLYSDWDTWIRFRDNRAKQSRTFKTWQETTTPEAPFTKIDGGFNPLLPPRLPSEEESKRYRDSAITLVMEFSKQHLQNENGEVRVLDCHELVTYMPNGLCEVRKGFWNGMIGFGFGAYMQEGKIPKK